MIADHIRACTFLLFDGVTPSNEGRGYVLRRIIRRAIRHGYSLGSRELFFSQLLPTVINTMEQYGEQLGVQRKRIIQTIDDEENQFRNTLEQGMNLLDKYLGSLSGKVIAGDTVFRLYDTFGFPVDLTNDIARERGLSLDMDGFDQSMKQQQEQSKKSHGFHADVSELPSVDLSSSFVGYQQCTTTTTITAIAIDGLLVQQVTGGQSAWLLLERTPFYAESGGQIGDIGTISTSSSRAVVSETVKQRENHWHLVTMDSGQLVVGDTVDAAIEQQRRQAITRNHSATHLLQASLRRHLGETVMQKGSLVSDTKLRFDFSHNKPVTASQIAEVEAEVNAQIILNNPVEIQQMSMAEASKANAVAFFEEKYGDQVRVVSMGALDNTHYSVELCGGSHVNRTGDIGSFHIIQETGIASGIRRIEAITATGVDDWLHRLESRLNESARLLKTDGNNLTQAITNIVEQNRRLQKQVDASQVRMASAGSSSSTEQVQTVAGIQTIIRRIDGVNPGALRTALDNYKSQLGQGAVLLIGEDQGKVVMVAGVTNNLVDTVSAVQWLQSLASIVDGKAGGRTDMAQGGGTDVSQITTLIDQATTALEKTLTEGNR